MASVSLIGLPFGGNNALILVVSAVRKVPDCYSDRRPARRQKPALMVHDTFVALSMSGRDRGYLARTGDPILDLAVGLMPASQIFADV